MALVFTLKDAVFTNYIKTIEPTTLGLVDWFDFGVSQAQSLINLGSGSNATWFGSATTFDSNSANIPQSSSNFMRSSASETTDFTIVACLKDSEFPKVMLAPNSGATIQHVSGGLLDLKVNVGTATELSTTVQKATPILVAGVTSSRVAEVEGNTEIYLSHIDSLGSQVVNNASGGVRDFASGFFDIGRANGVGSCNIYEILIYNRALTDAEILKSQEYLSSKYFGLFNK